MPLASRTIGRITAAIGAAALAAAPAAAADLTLTVDGFAAPEGFAMIAVYDSPAAMKAETSLASFRLRVNGSAQRVTLGNLPAGRYAVAAYHDRNGNGALDRNLLGMPTEPYAFANDARGSFGPPGFDAAALTVPADGTVAARITVRP